MAASTNNPVASGVQKIVLAVHGIGDQIRNETVLATVIRFCDHYGYPGMVALGVFHQGLQGKIPAFTITEPPPCDGLSGQIGFAEVYWADVARAVVDEAYTLQETKAWARSIVNRVRVLGERRAPGGAGIDYPRIRLVLDEILETLSVLEALLFLGRKAGLVEFDLKHLLDTFLGDVQLVTDFAPVCDEIVGRFHRALAAVVAQYPQAEIHLVAHSEGTVVAWLGLLEACTTPKAHPWINRVRGFMTIGSPIDKHLILWPALFAKFTGPGPRPPEAAKIHWVNYVDYGDPVGFELDTAREWMVQHRYTEHFAFDEKEDFAFSRYYVPGKAHVDYWTDPEVFGDFIKRVVAPPAAPTPADIARVAKGPRSLWTAQAASYIVGYLLPFATICLGVYFLVQGIEAYLDPGDALEHGQLWRTVLVLGTLLAGTTTWLRLGRLTRMWRWFFIGAGVYAVSAAAYGWLVLRAPAGAAVEPVAWLEAIPRAWGVPAGWGVLGSSVAILLVVFALNSSTWRQWRRKQAIATAKSSKPVHAPEIRNALRQMIWIGGATLLATALVNNAASVGVHGALWPVALASGAFLYLWWLATLLFDLVFVWHRYIRHAVALTFLREAVHNKDPHA